MNLIKSFLNAFRGIGVLLIRERNFQIHVVALLIVISAGLYFSIEQFEWLTIIIISTLVLALEGMNTSLEKLADEVSLERKESIRNIKDIAAGAVLISALAALVIAGLIFWKYF
jgi:diacylglycerol kinase